MAEEFGIPFQIYETPAHVYASIRHRNEEVIVELTAPKEGFDFGSNMESLLQTLVDSKLISRDELAEKELSNSIRNTWLRPFRFQRSNYWLFNIIMMH